MPIFKKILLDLQDIYICGMTASANITLSVKRFDVDENYAPRKTMYRLKIFASAMSNHARCVSFTS